jgi:hypothetical protein
VVGFATVIEIRSTPSQTARAISKRALEIDPKNPEVVLKLARILCTVERNQGGTEALVTDSALQSEEVKAGASALRRQDARAAIAALTAAAERNPNSSEVHRLLGMGSGGVLFDYDNDGWTDLFLVDGGSVAEYNCGCPRATPPLPESGERTLQRHDAGVEHPALRLRDGRMRGRCR